MNLVQLFRELLPCPFYENKESVYVKLENFAYFFEDENVIKINISCSHRKFDIYNAKTLEKAITRWNITK